MGSALDKDYFWSQATPGDLVRLSNFKRCLILVPHPDDESLGCAGLISLLLARHVKINVILTTDGAMSHPNSKTFPPKALSELRKAEFTNALAMMGVEESAITCYNANDGNMPKSGGPDFEELVTRLCKDLELMKPDLILVPYELDPHVDHKATHQLLLSSLTLSIHKPTIWEYPIWLYERAETMEVPNLKPGELISFDISSYLELKEKCIYAHRSQTTRLIADDPDGFILSREMIENFLHGVEYFMERKILNPESTLGKQYFDDVYRNSQDPWGFETSDYERAKYLATIDAIPKGSYQSAFEIGCSIGVLTEMLIKKCKHLVAMDISRVALEKARERLDNAPKIDFVLGAIPHDFPSGDFDLIVMSEVGYYLAMHDLMGVRQQIEQSLSPNGILVLVHWIHFVHDYPLTGDEVHNCFSELNWTHVKGSRTDDYRLDIYRKP